MNTDILNPEVSFPRDAFIQEDFNVDRFLQEYCSKSGLHKLHKELGVYIKYLQHVMIDIVNAESSAIVNLSSDLKILQNKFASISLPLGQFREEVSLIFKVIDLNLNNLKHLLERKETIVSSKSAKINELRILISSQKISRILLSHIEENTIDMEILERSVDQYILQQMYCQNCNFKELKSQISHSTDVLNQILNKVFLKSLLEKNVDDIIRCLQMYMLMNNQKIAENILATKIVRPALYDIINENTLKLCKGNLSELYNKIIEFTNHNMQLLLSVIEKNHGISGFNFILNSVWLEVHEQLKLNISSIYAPGNPAVFHTRFIQTCTFVSKFEQCFANDKMRLEFVQHPTYLAHKQQWNLPVYYEIRHLEIVQSLEHFFPEHVTNDIFTNPKQQPFNLTSSYQVWVSLKKCFEPDIYLPQLLDRFWKLNLQIISRFITWAQFLLKKNVPLRDATPETTNLIQVKLKFLAYLYLDVVAFNEKFNDPFNANTGLVYLSIISKSFHDIFKKSLVDPQHQLRDILKLIEDLIVSTVYADCSVHVKQISQIPRLFRKTNRSTPTTPSGYLSSLSKPIETFYVTYKPELAEDVMKRIMKLIHMKIMTEYKMLVENVLTSVTKTEESLRRLKKIRSGNGPPEASTITDDQKIKMQVQIDISHYCKEAEKYADSSSVNELLSLIKDVDVSDTK